MKSENEDKANDAKDGKDGCKDERKDKAGVKGKLVYIRKVLLLSTSFILFITIVSLVYGRVVVGVFTFRYVFSFNFIVGAIIILLALVVLIVPVEFSKRGGKLIDHSNYASTVVEKRENKRKTAHEILYLGICIIIIAAVAQLILSFIL